MTKQKSKTETTKVDVMDSLPTVQHGVEQAVEISNLNGQGESIKSQINSIALAWFAPFAEAGADADYLKSYSDKTEKNNLKRYTRDYFVEACSIAVVGRSGLAFLQDKNNSGDAELDISEGTLNGQLRSKKYIQSQYGKIISDVAKALRQAAKDAENGTDTKEKKERSDLDRASDGIAKANTQANKKKPDMSISEPLSEAICWLYDNQKALAKGDMTFADMVHADYFE
tara:strand:+ start:169 stop:852 length:684 start_codon:yes stop_codon:yes gene_type:complete